jgi:hypothetical protein
MKKIALGLVLSSLCGVASAQSCTSAVAHAFTGAQSLAAQNSCQASSTLAQFCGNTDAMNGAGVAVYSMQLAAGNTGVTVTVTPSGTTDAGAPPACIAAKTCNFSPYLAIQKPNATDGCNSTTGACLTDNQAAAVGDANSFSVPNGSPAGLYFIVVGDIGGDNPGCGPFTLAVAGNLPVSLQNFSIE